MSYHKVTAGDFMIYLVLTVVTLGIYPAWWLYSRVETTYRKSLGEEA